MVMTVSRLGEILIRARLITQEQLDQAMAKQKQSGGNLGTYLVRMGFLQEQQLCSFLSKHFGVPYVKLDEIKIDPSVLSLIPADIAQKHSMLPIKRTGSTLTVAMVDPSNISAIDEIKFITDYNVEPVITSETALKGSFDRHYDSAQTLREVMGMEDDGMEVMAEEAEVDVTQLKVATEEAPVVKLVNLLLSDAIKKGASDIHVEPYEKIFRIRYRIDGVLYDIMNPPMKMRAAIISRLKIMSELDISERRLPQDGRMKVRLKVKDVDLRVSSLPTLFGEKVVLRILDKSNLMLDMTKLGFESKQLEDFEEAITMPYGMVLVTGPTGSGKTTTLYSALDRLNSSGTNIMTAEDPVEFNLKGINQVQIREGIGLNFATALRAFLRQDPDIIMVGEIRDYETAEIAIKAALTGHLVLSTLHTNDAPSTINRLLNMGVEPFLVASSVNLILAQRLARRVCQDCKYLKKFPEKALLDLGFARDEVGTFECYVGKGCPTCSNTGYKGRLALYEVMPCKDEIREMILSGVSSSEIKKEAIRRGMKTLRASGLQKIKEGITTIEEVLRVTIAD